MPLQPTERHTGRTRAASAQWQDSAYAEQELARWHVGAIAMEWGQEPMQHLPFDFGQLLFCL